MPSPYQVSFLPIPHQIPPAGQELHCQPNALTAKSRPHGPEFPAPFCSRPQPPHWPISVGQSPPSRGKVPPAPCWCTCWRLAIKSSVRALWPLSGSQSDWHRNCSRVATSVDTEARLIDTTFHSVLFFLQKVLFIFCILFLKIAVRGLRIRPQQRYPVPSYSIPLWTG